MLFRSFWHYIGVDLIGYLDNATTSFPKASGVAERMGRAVAEHCSTAARGRHRLEAFTEEMVANVRLQIATSFGLTNPAHVIFTSGTTESLNVAIKGLMNPGDHAVASCFEHNSVLRPLYRLKENGCRVSIPRRSDLSGDFDEAIIREFRPETRLVVLTHASNVSGAVLPILTVAEEAQRRGIAVLLDAAQTVGHRAIDLKTLPVDLVAFGAHKGLLGPPGIGCLLVNRAELNLKPLKDGGTGYNSEDLRPEVRLPQSFEVGTPNVPGIAGFGAALAVVTDVAFANERERVNRLCELCCSRLNDFSHITIHGRCSGMDTVPIVAFSAKGILAERVANILDDEFDIQCRAGLHCAPLAHQAFGTYPTGAVRVSFGYGNTEETVSRLCDGLQSLRDRRD